MTPKDKHEPTLGFISPKMYPVLDSSCSAIFGGAEVQMCNLALCLSKKRRTTVFVNDYGQPAKMCIDEVNIVQTFKLGRLANPWSVLRKLLSAKCERYIISNLSRGSIILGILLMYLFRKKVIHFVMHDNEVNRKFTSIIFHFLHNLYFKSAKLVVQNEYQKSELRKKNIEAICINPTYVFKNNQDSPRDYVFWMARSETWKRGELFVDLARSLPTQKFVMVCPPSYTNPSYSHRLQLLANTVPNLKFVEAIKYSDVMTYFSKARIFVNTSEMEGFPTTFIEAAVSGVPILSLSVDPSRIIEKNQIGKCCRGDVRLLRKYLLEILNIKNYNRMQKNCRVYAEREHDATRNIATILTLIEEGKL